MRKQKGASASFVVCLLVRWSQRIVSPDGDDDDDDGEFALGWGGERAM